MNLIGLVGMIDPARPEVKDAIQVATKAGIKTVMITGDHIVTACAIARDLGILKEKIGVCIINNTFYPIYTIDYSNVMENCYYLQELVAA